LRRRLSAIRKNPVGLGTDKCRGAYNWLLPDRMQRNGKRAMMLVAGPMTATTRADIAARRSSPTVKRGLRFAYGRVMTLVSSNDDLAWEFAFDSRLGHPTGIGRSQWRKGQRNRVRNCPSCIRRQPASLQAQASFLFVTVSAGRDHQSVRSLPTSTRDLNALADWLQNGHG
jgi:hypothetical protein